MMKKLLSCILLVAAGLLLFRSGWADWSYNYDTAWMDDFSQGAPDTQPSRWQDADNGGREVELIYSYQDSYAALTRSAETMETGDVFSENIHCNVDVFDTVEIRVVDSISTSVTSWSIGLQESSGDRRYHILHDFTGATGTFSFHMRDMTGWSGTQDFSIRLAMKGAVGEYLVIDYVSIFRNPTDKKSFWREDFVGEPNTQIRSWWDETEDNTLNAEIRYSDSTLASSGNIELIDDGGNSLAPWGKVLSPGIIWDTEVYDHIEMQITSVAINTSWQLWVRELGNGWPGVSITAGSGDGVFTFDVHDIPGWLWSGPTLMAFELYIEGTQVGVNYDLDYIQVYRPQATPTPVVPVPTPSPTAAVFPQGGFATPNPFLPNRGEKVFFNFILSGSQSAYTIRIMNLQGRIVKKLASKNEWDGRDNQGRLCEGGIYIYQIESGDKRVSGKLVLIH